MYLIILLSIVLILLLFQLKLVNNDIFHPSIIVFACYVFSLTFALIERENWEISISRMSCTLILIGLIVYMIISMACRNVIFTIGSKQKRNFYHSIENESCIDIDDLVMILVDLFGLAVAYKYFSDVRTLSASIGSSDSLSTMIYMYRVASVNGTLKAGVSRVASHGYQMLFALSFVSIYIIALHVVCKKRHGAQWFIIRVIPVLCAVFCSLVAGSRNPLLQVALGVAVIFYIFLRACKAEEKKFQLRTAMKFIVAGCILLFVFVQLKSLLGRVTDYNFLDYLAEYIAAPIKNFDSFISKGKRNDTGIWGKETFVNVWKFIGNLTENKELSDLQMNKEFNFVNGMSLGNVYTAFREYYYDFGVSGIIILTGIHSFVYTTLYSKIRSVSIDSYKSYINKDILVYAFISQALFYFSVDDRFYQAYLSSGTLEAILFILIFAYWLPKVRLLNNVDV